MYFTLVLTPDDFMDHCSLIHEICNFRSCCVVIIICLLVILFTITHYIKSCLFDFIRLILCMFVNTFATYCWACKFCKVSSKSASNKLRVLKYSCDVIL